MKSEYDVIVVGAGPAGSIAACTAARQGLDVLLLEKRQEIGEPVRCAEGIIKEGLEDFIEYDPRWVCAEIRGARFHSPDGGMIGFSQKSDEPAGFVLDRKVFDRALAKKAASAGSEIRVKTQATGLLADNGAIAGITGISGGREFEARARIVIGADGVESSIGRWAGLLGPLKLKDIGSCAEFLISGVDLDQECLDFYLGNDISPGGYLWIFPKGGSEANVGLGISGSRFKGMYPIEYLKKFVNERFPGANILQTMFGGVPICDMNGRISTGGLMLAGDGARLVDPLIGAGIMNAMISGRMAGERAAEAIKKGDVSGRELKKYDDGIRECMGKAIRRNYLIKEFLVNASDRQINALFGSLRRTNVESMPVTSLYRTATTKGLPILKVMRALL